MADILRIALRNLMRYRRRTYLTASLIAVGVTFVLLFLSASGSFQNLMIGQITDAMLGHIQVHKRGYMASIDSLPLNLNLEPEEVRQLTRVLSQTEGVSDFSPRLKFPAMLSNFMETTNIRINGVIPRRETAVIPLLPGRVREGNTRLLKGELYVPELLARGMQLKIGDLVAVIATNEDGLVNGKKFRVSAIIESVTGPGGRDGYMHLEDARDILRITDDQISEVAIRVSDFSRLEPVAEQIRHRLAGGAARNGRPVFDVRTWEGLTPFVNISRMIDVMAFFIRLMLIAVVLVSVMNVMIMAVYERIREIGTIAAIGTKPSRIRTLFLCEGFMLGILGTGAGILLTGLATLIINSLQISFNFGRQAGLILTTGLELNQVVLVSLIVIVVSTLAALQPAHKAARMKPVDALGHV